jgi:hypothetical protein
MADAYDAAVDAGPPEVTRFANAIQTWWPAILAALTERVLKDCWARPAHRPIVRDASSSRPSSEHAVADRRH